jgi:hypothetical protein
MQVKGILGMKIRRFFRVFPFILVLLSASPALAGTGGPRMVLKEQQFDFREVLAGKTLEHAFRVFNQGDQDLVIQRVRPG